MYLLDLIVCRHSRAYIKLHFEFVQRRSTIQKKPLQISLAKIWRLAKKILQREYNGVPRASYISSKNHSEVAKISYAAFGLCLSAAHITEKYIFSD